MKLLMLKGLPASGKSTYAKQLVSDSESKHRKWVRVNKDDLRAMLHAGKWSASNEKQVLTLRDGIVGDSLARGRNVVVDDTNFAPQHEKRLRELAEAHGAEFETKFFDTPLDVCIERDRNRAASVGAGVIKKMYKEYLYVEPQKPSLIPALNWAILCDIDGTLAKMGNRSPYDWKSVGKDTVVEEVKKVLDAFSNHQLILLSGRDEVCRPETEDWLKRNNVYYDTLLMRPEGDNRKDTIVKEELYNNHIVGKYNVRFVMDDRNQVVEMWRRNGLKCFQVEEGDF